MVATLVRLRLRLLANTLVAETWRLVMVILGTVYALSALLAAVVGMILVAGHEPEYLPLLLGLVGAAVHVGWLLLPVLAFGMDSTMDPRNFAPFVAPSARLAVGLLVAGGVGIPGVATALGFLLVPCAWLLAGHPGSALLALVLAPVATVTCWALARVVTSVFRNLGRTRRGRDSTAMLTIALLVPVSMAGLVLPPLARNFSVAGAWRVVEVLAWTPFGAALAAPADIAAGQWAAAGARVVIAVGSLALLLYLWHWQLPTVMMGRAGAPAPQVLERWQAAGSTPQVSHGPQAVHALPWAHRFALLPGVTPVAAAIAARLLRYRLRDPRYLANVVMTGVMALALSLLLPVTIDIMSDGGLAAFAQWPYAMAGLAGLLLVMGLQVLHTDIALDSTAFSLHVAAGVSGRDEMRGRALSVLTVYGPLVLLVAGVNAWRAPTMTGGVLVLAGTVSLSLVVVGLALALAGRFIYPVPPPGASPLQNQGTGQMGFSLLVQLVVMAGIVVGAILPAVVVWATVAGYLPLALTVLVLLGYGSGVFAGLLRVAAAGVERHAVRFLTEMRSWPGH
ncbi:hypothetical protein [Buchananella hordeovulneris]|uniref:hypothetical protein n=1 Tax=Buchananella hordeovulneris TaxID=52770 RepID=UPI0026DC7230|nr:hypothetical protein [Buchananella hordeovulneris]MDO5081529.1 hypothetical protein [Buchananella hordeovulneris]